MAPDVLLHTCHTTMLCGVTHEVARGGRTSCNHAQLLTDARGTEQSFLPHSAVSAAVSGEVVGVCRFLQTFPFLDNTDEAIPLMEGVTRSSSFLSWVVYKYMYPVSFPEIRLYSSKRNVTPT